MSLVGLVGLVGRGVGLDEACPVLTQVLETQDMAAGPPTLVAAVRRIRKDEEKLRHKVALSATGLMGLELLCAVTRPTSQVQGLGPKHELCVASQFLVEPRFAV